MPNIKPGESRERYVARCIAFVTNKEGLDQQAAAGKCGGMYDQHAKSIQGMGTDGIETDCGCQDKTQCTCKTLGYTLDVNTGIVTFSQKPKRKTMTPEEIAALKEKEGGQAPPPESGSAPPPPTEGATSDEAPSVQVSKAVYTSLKNLQGNLAAADNTYENPDAKGYFKGAFTEKCNEMMGEIKGLISKLGSSTGDDEAPTEGAEGSGEAVADPNEDEEAMKSFLALGNTNDLKLMGYVAPLNALSKAKNLTPDQKLCLGGVLKSIRGLCDSAKANSEAAKRKALTSQVSILQENYGGLTKSIADLQSSMGQLLGK